MQQQQAAAQGARLVAAASRLQTWHSPACTGAAAPVKVTGGRSPRLAGPPGQMSLLMHVSDGCNCCLVCVWWLADHEVHALELPPG